MTISRIYKIVVSGTVLPRHYGRVYRPSVIWPLKVGYSVMWTFIRIGYHGTNKLLLHISNRWSFSIHTRASLLHCFWRPKWASLKKVWQRVTLHYMYISSHQPTLVSLFFGTAIPTSFSNFCNCFYTWFLGHLRTAILSWSSLSLQCTG